MRLPGGCEREVRCRGPVGNLSTRGREHRQRNHADGHLDESRGLRRFGIHLPDSEYLGSSGGKSQPVMGCEPWVSNKNICRFAPFPG